MRQALTRELPYPPGPLFDLVGDVERYPPFVPWVSSLTTSNRRDEAGWVTTFDALAQVGFSFVHEQFSTHVKLDRPALAIDVQLLSGPFRRLENRWRFVAAPGGTTVSFEIDFEFKSRMLSALLAANMGRAARRLIGCFEDRARQLYGRAV